MKSGGYDKEDKFLDASRIGTSAMIKQLQKNKAVKNGLNSALGLSKSTALKLGNGAKKLTGGLKPLINALKTVFLKRLPKQLLAGVGIFSLSLSAFSSCAYLANKEGDGETGSYIDHGNSVSITDEGEEITYSNANANCMAYYKILSERKSVWQEYTDESGEVVLIHPTDSNAVRDYFKNDLAFYLEPDLLFALNDAVFGNDTVYPEAFLNPVPYDENTYELASLTDADGNLAVTSVIYDETGKDTGKEKKSVSDYGLASVLSYESYDHVSRFAGDYYKEQYITDDGLIAERDIEESFDFVIKTETKHVLSHAVTFAGDISYSYEPSTTRTGSVKEGAKSVDECEATEMYEYYNGAVAFGKATRNITDEEGNTYTGAYMTEHVPEFDASYYKTEKQFLKYEEGLDAGYTDEEISEWMMSQTKTFDVDGKTITVSYSYKPNYRHKDVSLSKYRTLESGTFVDFVNQGKTETHDLGNQYLYDYMEYFSCYLPMNISRSYNSFLNMTSQASNTNSILSSGGNKYGFGSGKNAFEQIYNGSDEGKENLEMIWDVLVDFGYTEEQASAVMGNLAQESGYSPTAVNSSSGAFGLCQWLGCRKEQLDNFAGENHVENTDLYLQINFACMELSTEYRYDYCDYQWLEKKYGDTFAQSNDIDELTEAVTRGFERCGEGEANMSNRLSNAHSAYETLAGRTITHHAMDIEPSDTAGGGKSKAYDTSAVTRNMNEGDKKEFNRFYHAVDDIYSGDYVLKFTTRPKGKSEVDKILLLTNSFINQTPLSKERLNTTQELWSANYLTDLSRKKKSVADLYGVANGVFLWGVSPDDATPHSGSFFGPRDNSNYPGASSHHQGIDLNATRNCKVYAICDGVITFCAYNGTAGNQITLETEMDGHILQITFMHNTSFAPGMAVGKEVKQGEVIAYAGDTGKSFGVHCHLKLTVDGISTNPWVYLYGSPKQIPAIDKDGNVVYIDVDVTPGEMSSGEGTEWNTYYQYINGDYTRYEP